MFSKKAVGCRWRSSLYRMERKNKNYILVTSDQPWSSKPCWRHIQSCRMSWL